MDMWHILLWRDIKVSAIVFVSGFVLLVCLTQFSVVGVLSNGALVCLTPMLAFRLLLTARSSFHRTEFQHPFKKYLANDATVDKERMDHWSEKMAQNLIHVISRVKSLFLVEDLPDSCKLLVVLYLVSYLAAWFSGITLAFMAFVGAFTIPKLYDMYQDDIIAVSKKIETVFDDVMNKIHAKFQPEKDDHPKPLEQQETEAHGKEKAS